MEPLELLTAVIDYADEGFICVDTDGIVTLFNHKAKEIIGIASGRQCAHPPGSLIPGDIVLIVDNVIGGDDGDLRPEDLGVLGIEDPALRVGGALLAAGVYKNNSIAPFYRCWGRNAGQPRMALETDDYLGLSLHLEIDWVEKQAKEIHLLSRPGTPFVEVNCTSIPRELVESELFGYVAGAFTGALTSGKVGYFEAAEGGTLFLDEIGEIPWEIQVKLLYVIQNRRFYRIGATKPSNVDVRIIFATNKNLEEEVRQGHFRADLYYRISVFPIEIPPLRERKSDIYLLSKDITERICAEYNVPPKQLSAKAVEKLLHYDWPGNIRELGNVIERSIAICDASVIYPEDILLKKCLGGDSPQQAPLAEGQTLRTLMSAIERQAILTAIAACNGNKKLAMEQLGLHKTTFYEKLHQYGIK